MRSIRPIPTGQQIYNTYGNLPNSDLLRRYGYVIPGSRDDIVEIPSEMIVESVSSLPKEEVEKRIAVLEEEEIFEESSLALYWSYGLGHLRFYIRERYLKRCICFAWQ